MQLHTERLQIGNRGRLLWMATQQADRFETQTLASRRECVQMIGMRATEADHALRTGAVGGLEMLGEFEPFVAADQPVDLVQTQDRDLDSGGGEPVELKQFEGAWGSQSEGKSISVAASEKTNTNSTQKTCRSCRRLRSVDLGL